MRRLILLLFSHGAALAVGFAMGIYLLPILIAPESPDSAMLQQQASSATYSAEFTRDLQGSDFLHWGEGKISLTPGQIIHEGRLAPGPDYKLYLLNGFVEDEAGFEAVKEQAVRIGDVRTFDGFLVDIPSGVNIEDYDTVLVWCESFAEFITAAKYR